VFLGEQRARSYSTTTPGLYPCLLVSLDDALVSLDDALVFTRGRKGTLFRALLRIHAMQARIGPPLCFHSSSLKYVGIRAPYAPRMTVRKSLESRSRLSPVSTNASPNAKRSLAKLSMKSCKYAGSLTSFLLL